MTDKINGRVSYDAEADAIGIYFKPEGAEYEGSDEIAPGVVLDYDKQGRVIGVELLSVRELLAKGSSLEQSALQATSDPVDPVSEKPAA